MTSVSQILPEDARPPGKHGAKRQKYSIEDNRHDCLKKDQTPGKRRG